MDGFTDEDQKLLDELSYRKAVSTWQAREAARKARLASFADLAKQFTSAKITPLVSVATDQAEALKESEPVVAEMLSNIATVVGYGGLEIVRLLETLAIAEPEPTRPSTPAEPATEAVDPA